MNVNKMNELIPEQSTYSKQFTFVELHYGDLPVEQVEPLMQKLKEAWELAGYGMGVKHGDTDEADAISLIMSQIQKKYQDRATQEQRSTWQ